MGVRTSEISEASSTSLATVTTTGMNLLLSSTNLLISLSRKMMARGNFNIHDSNCKIVFWLTSALLYNELLPTSKENIWQRLIKKCLVSIGHIK